MIHIDIEIQKPNRFKDLLHKIFNRLEDLMFSIVQKLPEKFIPHFLMEWLDWYTTKRINQLKQESIKNTWRNMYLQKAVDDIHNRQQNIKQ